MSNTGINHMDKATDTSSFNPILAERMSDIPRSFIREILKVAVDPNMISLAGGLPNKDFFPVEALQTATNKVFEKHGRNALQYSTTEGLPSLREHIAEAYRKRGTTSIAADDILITSGSQQALDLLAKALINEGDKVIIEEPSYLGAIQALAIFRPQFMPVPLNNDGIDVAKVQEAIAMGAKMMYIIPNFQNPSGISYSLENRKQLADAVRGTSVVIVEDDPYGDLRFAGQRQPSMKDLIPENTVLLGSFSKILTPGFRLGWMAAPKMLLEAATIAKQAADLQSGTFAQYVVNEYLNENDISSHMSKVIEKYRSNKNAMYSAVEKYFPASVARTNPEGGMFMWMTLPKGISAMKFFELGVQEKVCVVPGHPFFIGKADVSSFRLSFSSLDEATIEEGIRRLGAIAHKLCG